MSRLILLNKVQQQKFDAVPHLTSIQQQKFFAINETIEDYVLKIRKPVNKVGFLCQLAYFRASGKFFSTLEFREKDITFACKMLRLNSQQVDLSITSYTDRNRIYHKKAILNMLAWQAFNSNMILELKTQIAIWAKQQLSPKSLFPMASQFLLHRNIELPPYYVLANIITDAYNKVEDILIGIVDKMLTPHQKQILDDIILIEDRKRKDYKYSCLAKIKQMPLSIKLTNILDSIETFKLVKEFYNTFAKLYSELNLPETTIQYYATWVQKAKVFQLKQFKQKAKGYLYLLAYMQHQYYLRNDLYIDIILKTMGIALNRISRQKDQHKQALIQEQKEALKRIAILYASSTNILYEALNILNNEQISNNDKVNKTKLTLENFISSNNQLSYEDKKKIENLIFHDSAKFTNKIEELQSIYSKVNKKLAPILHILDFDSVSSNKNLIKAINILSKSSKEWYLQSWLSLEEVDLLFNSGSKSNIAVYKGLLFTKIYTSIKAGKLNLASSYRYLPIEKYLIDNKKWTKDKLSILNANGLERFGFLPSIMSELKATLDNKYTTVNKDYIEKANKYLSFGKDNRLKVATPGRSKLKSDNPIASVFSKVGIVSIRKVLEDTNHITEFTKCFKHHANKRVKMQPSSQIIYAGILSKGCNHGIRKMANISKGITEDKLKNTLNWFFSLENIQAASNKTISYINNLALPNIYKFTPNINHTSSDGQKFNVGVDSILANYSFKYFGTEQGVSIYSFIDDRQVLFYNTVISPTEREAAYVIDGLLANESIKSDIHSTDTHGYTEMIFAVTHMLGISFAPRIKKVGKQKIYSIERTNKYPPTDFKIRPDHKINFALILKYWDDILRFVATIKSKTARASQLFKRLNSYTKEYPLYKALREFGRIIKSIYILTYIDNLTLRQVVDRQLNKIELSNKFSKAVFFANGQEFKVGSHAEQLLIVACKSFIQNCIVLWNYLMLSQELINAPNQQSQDRLLVLIKQNSVISWQHVNLYGEYDFTVANDENYSFDFEIDKICKLKFA